MRRSITVSLALWAAAASLSAFAQPSAEAPAPTGIVVGSGNFFSPIVRDLDAALAFYRDGLGLEVRGEPGDASDNLPLRNMFGLPDARIRWQIARPGGMTTGVEIVEISGAGGKPLARRIQDPGAASLIVFVRDIAATLARLAAIGTPIVSQGAVPATLPFGPGATALMAIVQDPDGHFVELVEPEQMPATQAPASSNVVDVRVRLIVEDVEQSMRLYRDALGLAVMTPLRSGNDATISAALGVPGATYRFGILQVPTSGLVFEVMDFTGIERRNVRGRIQDPGSTRMQLRVRDVDEAIAAFERRGGAVVSTGGKPLELPIPNSSIKVAIVREPDNLFVVLIETPPAARD
jgi:catechol 2,3-dioxygenase-like lactoylglutathione lyase family enzyme